MNRGDMNASCLRVAVGRNPVGTWHERFAEALSAKQTGGYPLEFDFVEMEKHDWIAAIAPFDLVIWMPSYNGPIYASHVKEKIYFMERFLGKLVVPNYSTIWHLESKVAQSYIFAHHGVPTPETFASFNYRDSTDRIGQTQMPVVWKKSYGSGSENVRLATSRRWLRRQLSRQFCSELWENRRRGGSKARSALLSIGKPWFWELLRRRLKREEPYGLAYWQDFVPGNEMDLRITAIGDAYAAGFWRRNRPDDFRASGSGLLDYSRQIPENVVRYCLKLNHDLGFDSMAYDILFSDGVPVITEMSFGYVDRAVLEGPGWYELMGSGELVCKAGHVWPQQLWVEWALRRAERGKGSG